MKIRYIVILMALFLSYNVNAQDEEESAVTISGSVDAYFRTNLTAPNDENAIAPGTSFANLPGFALGMVNIVTSYEGEKAGFVADLVFGPRGADAVFASPYRTLNGDSPDFVSQAVNQLYAYWNVSDAVTLTLGNFNTFLGYEVISPAANFNYSTSYMFSYGPFSHTGLKADFTFSDNVTGMLAIMNPTDLTEFNPVGTYTYGAQVGVGGMYFNFLYGDQDGKLDEDTSDAGDTSNGSTFQADLTAGWDLSESLYLGVNATYNTTSTGEAFDGTDISDVDGDSFGFYGLAGYFQVATSDAFSIGTRIEYFKEFAYGAGAIGEYDDDGDANVIDVTLTGQYKVGGLTIIPEFRFDTASEEPTFYNKDLEPSKSLASFVLAAVYAF